jgi:hypothetical protein
MQFFARQTPSGVLEILLVNIARIQYPYMQLERPLCSHHTCFWLLASAHALVWHYPHLD